MGLRDYPLEQANRGKRGGPERVKRGETDQTMDKIFKDADGASNTDQLKVWRGVNPPDILLVHEQALKGLDEGMRSERASF